MHSEALSINSGPFGCQTKDMLLQIPVVVLLNHRNRLAQR